MATGGIGHVTQQNRNIGIAIEQRDRNCKIGEEVGSPVKSWRRTAGELVITHTPLRDPIREEANAGTHIGCNSYYYGRRTGMMEKICMTWQRWCNATYPF